MKHAGEVETSGLFDGIWRDHPNIRTLAPRVNDETGEIDALPYVQGTQLAESRRRIPEPVEGDPVDPREIDLVVVPLLAFDRNGFRVGYGRGYYDRFLAKCRLEVLKVGLSFFPPIERIDDVHDGDVALDAAITPEEVFRMETGSRNPIGSKPR